jgi:hypothetical protein
MSEAKFTKGDWKISDGYRVGVEVSFGDGFFNIATCQIFNEAKANAHLIASAPEMYRVIEQIVRWQDSDGGELDEYMNNSNIAFKMLLAKARGEK